MKVFLTGADGYIGAMLVPLLLARDHEIVCLDAGFFRRGWWYSPTGSAVAPAMLNIDVRHTTAPDLEGCDAVVHLAELSNDPLGELNPQLTMAINHQGSLHLASMARLAGVPRFVYSSSCSVYGAGTSDWLTEAAETRPQTTYARCKVLVEQGLQAMAGPGFSPVLLRNATAYGASPRMRFDLVVNNLCGLARVTGRIAMTSDGTPWRPLVHVRDICRAIACALEAPRDRVHGETFNVGRNDQNFQVREIAAVVGEAFPQCAITMGEAGADSRSYRVSFDKIHRELPGFDCDWDVRRGVFHLRDVFERVGLDGGQFGFPAYTRLDELRYLLATGQLDSDLFWTA